MIKIGYNSDALEGNINDMLYIFEITNQSLLMEPSVESLHKAFMDMVKRSQATEAQLRSAGLGDHAIKSIEKIKDPYRNLLNQFQRGRTTPLSEGEISTRVHNLIEEVNSSPFTDTYPPEANYVLDNLSQPAKSGGRIKAYSDYLKRNNTDIDTDLKYIILNILNKHFATYPQYTNNGYTLSVLGNKGVGEYHMITEHIPSTTGGTGPTLLIGFNEKRNGLVYYTAEQIVGR